MAGRVPASLAVYDTAVPLRPPSDVVGRMAIAEGATKLNEDFMTISSHNGTEMPSRCEQGITHIQLANASEFEVVEMISADAPPPTDSSLEAAALSDSCCAPAARAA
jgi:hypothetical protein